MTKTFCLGLTVLAAPSKWKSDSHTKIRVHILAHMQAVALQWARLVVSQQPASAFPSMLATAWASQTALWQLEWLPDDQQRSLILPRLGESMARRLIQQEGEQSSPSAEIQLLCLRTLEYQSKWSEMLELLEKLPVPSSDDGDEQQPPTISSEFGVALTTQQILTQKARILSRLEQYEAARKVYENLLKTSPDDWSCWKGHLEGCIKSDKLDLTDSLVEMVLTQQADSKYPLRGPHLMKVEIAAHRVRTETTNDGHVRALATTIQDYSQLFAPRAACTFSDLDTYIELLARTNVPSTNAVIQSLLDFSEKMRKGNSSSKEGENVSNKERQSKLRSYIFATKLNHKLISIHKDFEDRWLPNWSKLVNEWQTTLSLSSSNEGEEVGPSMIFIRLDSC